jgi:hypothetical protein
VSDRHEARLLLAVLAEHWDEAARLVSTKAPNPEVFVALAVQCDVAPQVHSRIIGANREDLIGEAAVDRLAAFRRKTGIDNLVLLASLERGLDLLLRAGIVPIALKGVDVLHRLYSRFDERTLDDIDLLVRPSDRDRALSVLEAAGWKGPAEGGRAHWLRTSFEMPLTSPDAVEVAWEIHWSLGQDVRYRIDADSVIARARPLRVAGRDIARLDDHDGVAHLLLHHVQHYFDRRLKWVLDLGSLSRQPGFDWTAVAARLSEWGGLGAAGLALAHVRQLFPGLIDPAAARAIPAQRWRLAATLPLRSRHPLDFYRATRRRWVQLLIATAALERPAYVPRYIRQRAARDRSAGGA